MQETSTKDGSQMPTIVLDSGALAEDGVIEGGGRGRTGRTLLGGFGGGRVAECRCIEVPAATIALAAAQAVPVSPQLQHQRGSNISCICDVRRQSKKHEFGLP